MNYLVGLRMPAPTIITIEMFAGLPEPVRRHLVSAGWVFLVRI
jgi:hypothetical protein